jgi:hypothetical protein
MFVTFDFSELNIAAVSRTKLRDDLVLFLTMTMTTFCMLLACCSSCLVCLETTNTTNTTHTHPVALKIFLDVHGI